MKRPTRAARPGRPAAPAGRLRARGAELQVSRRPGARRKDRRAATTPRRRPRGPRRADTDAGVRHLMSTQEPTDDEIEDELNTMLGAPAAAAALADVHVKQEA